LGKPFLTILLALAAATCWGSADFTGALAARRSDSFRAVLVAYFAGLVTLLAVALARGETLLLDTNLIWGMLSGIFGMLAVIFLWRGLAVGRMGVVAPVSAVLATAIPVIVEALTTGLPRTLQLIGFGVALVGIWLLSRPERLGSRPKGLGMAILSGLGFGATFTALGQISGEAIFWPMTAGRVVACGGMMIFALVTGRPLALRSTPLRLLIMAGVIDILGNIFFLLATQNGRLDIAAVLASLYPAMTAILARLTLKEHLTRPQFIGFGAAALGIILITL
jgi:uncharacterized membrane protein